MQKQNTCLSFFLLLNICGYMLKVDLSSRYVREREGDKRETQRSPMISFWYIYIKWVLYHHGLEVQEKALKCQRNIAANI